MLLIADNLHAMSPAVARALREKNALPLMKIAERCMRANAYAMDINLGPMSHHAAEAVTFAIEAVQDSFSGRLVLDSVQEEVLAAGIEACRQPPIINGFSLEEHKLTSILPLAAHHRLDIIGFLIDERGQVPPSADERLEVASRLVAAAEDHGIPLEKIIIDPVLVPLSWQEGTHYNRELLAVVRFLPHLFGRPVRTIAGLSNLGTGAPDRAARARVETCFLLMLAALDLDYILMNGTSDEYINALNLNRVLLGEKVFSWQEV